MKINKALFLDRDGVINHDYGYVHKIDDFIFVEGIFDLVKKAKKENYLVIIVTNQSGIGRGFYSEDDFMLLMDWVRKKFSENDGFIDDIFFCPSHPVHGIGKYKVVTNLRKPNPGMFFEAKEKYQINLTKSVLIGDKISDIQAGKAAGIKTNILFTQDNDKSSNEYFCIKRLSDAKNYI